MADAPLRTVIRHLRRIVGRGGVPSPTDAQLLKAFLQHRDEGAIEMLIWRHGNMILDLCRRILRDEHHAEDAFQATFVVFVCKAKSIHKGQSVSSWLYKVAYRIAHDLRASLAKQPEATAHHLNDVPASETAHALAGHDLRPLLDEEINRLPEKYRAPLVLCYLQGHTAEEAATLLGCSKAAIWTRLSRGRDRLRSILIRRGLAPAAGGLAAHLSINTSSAAVSSTLVDNTVKTAIVFATGRSALGLVSNSITTLAQRVVRSMLISKLINMAVIMFAAVVLSVGAGSVARWAMADTNPNRGQVAQSSGHNGKQTTSQAEPVAGAAAVSLPRLDKKPGLRDRQSTPKPLPPEIIKAWQDAGAEVGWLQVIDYGEVEFAHQEKRLGGATPSFMFSRAPGAILTNLPDPEVAFGLRFDSITDVELKNLAGLKSLQWLQLTHTQVADTGLKELAALKNLQRLYLRDTQVTNAGMKELAGMESLQELSLWGTQVTDEGLKELAGLKHLRSLQLSGTWVTDAGLKELVGLKSLQSLRLPVQVTDAGLKQLAGMESLLELSLCSTQVTDEGLKQLAGLKNLQYLELSRMQITDAGLKELAGLKNLQYLELTGTSQITDAGLKELGELKNLRELYLSGTLVTKVGIATLQRALPECEIVHWFP